MLYLVSEDAPNKTIRNARAPAPMPSRKIVETDGVWLPTDEQNTEGIAANWAAITATEGEKCPRRI